MDDAETILRERAIDQRYRDEMNPGWKELRFVDNIVPHDAFDIRLGPPRREDARKEVNPLFDLFATWILFKEEPGMDDILDKAGDSLDKMFEFYKIYPVNINKERKLYLARFELAKFDEDLQFPEASFMKSGGKVVGFVDFLSGFPMDTPEALLMIGEISSREIYKHGKLPVMDAKGEITSPVPNNFFEAFDDQSLLLNYLYLESDQGLVLADNLSGEPDANGLHWWVRTNFLAKDGAKFPYPGEFWALAIRMMPDRFSDEQESAPFLFAGNWIDTVYYSSGIIKSVDEPTDQFPFPTYTVQWRGKTYSPVMATDFTEYKEGDRVVLLKDVETKKTSQLWKDDDMDPDKNNDFKQGKWVIAPMMFYGYDPEKED